MQWAESKSRANCAVQSACRSLIETLESRWLLASISTNQPDYAFGSTALISGDGFAADELVQFQITHAPDTAGSNDDPQNQPWQVQADDAGDVHTAWVVDDPDAAGSTYILTATGVDSGETAQTTFTDATS